MSRVRVGSFAVMVSVVVTSLLAGQTRAVAAQFEFLRPIQYDYPFETGEAGGTVELLWGFDEPDPYPFEEIRVFQNEVLINTLSDEVFGVEVTSLPSDYQSYLKFLHEQGVRITANGFWNALTQVEEQIKDRKNILPFVEPLTLAEFLEHRQAATVYLRF